MKDTKPTEFFTPDPQTKVKIPMFSTKISAGFPSPAEDFVEQKLDLNQHLIKHPAATFLVRVEGESMIDAGIMPGSILIVDRSLNATNGKIVVAILDGEFTVKRIKKTDSELWLIPENSSGQYKPTQITQESDFEVWGVVTSIIQEVE